MIEIFFGVSGWLLWVYVIGALCFSEVGFQGVFVFVFGDIMGDFYGWGELQH